MTTKDQPARSEMYITQTFPAQESAAEFRRQELILKVRKALERERIRQGYKNMRVKELK